MLDEDALSIIHLLDGWDWQQPASISEIEYRIALDRCAEVLLDGPASGRHSASELRILVDNSNRKLFGFMPSFRRIYKAAEGHERKQVLDDALARCCNRFERRIVMGAVDAADRHSR